MHVKVMNIIFGAIFFILLSVAELIYWYNKGDKEFIDVLKRIGIYALVAVFIALFTTL